jgi:GT2 family glycosyltransferase
MADVSVVIPVYNHDRFVRMAIESVLSQTVRPREILCIDDGSTDSSAQILEAIAAQHPNVRFWSRSNRGAHLTINEGIREAGGEYVTILNSDDLYHPDRLRHCLAVLEEDAGVTAVATEISFVDENDNPIRYPWYEETHAFYQRIGDLGLALVNGNFLMATSNIVARRAVFDEIGGFDDLRYAHDLDFFLRLLAHGKRLEVLPEPLLAYRVHGSNTIFEAPFDLKVETATAIAFFARSLASMRGASGPAPMYLSRILEITERQQLTRLVMLALLHAKGQGTGALSPGSCVSDPAFRSAAWHEAALVGVVAPERVDAASPSPPGVSNAEPPLRDPHTTATMPIWRRLVDRILSGSPLRRFFRSVRWRSGLDADLQELRDQLDRLSVALNAARGCAANDGERFAVEVRQTAQVLGNRLATLDSAHRELAARGEAVESRVSALESSLAATGSQAGGQETEEPNADHPRAQTRQRGTGALVREASPTSKAAR